MTEKDGNPEGRRNGITTGVEKESPGLILNDPKHPLAALRWESAR